MMTFNTTNNFFYETVLLKKKDQPKAIIVPNENEKLDFGKPSKKFDFLFCENFHSASSGKVLSGSWTPRFDWKVRSGSSYIPATAAQVPTVTIEEAKYEKTGNIVRIVLKITLSPRSRTVVGSNIKNLPYPLYSKTPFSFIYNAYATNTTGSVTESFQPFLISSIERQTALFGNSREIVRKQNYPFDTLIISVRYDSFFSPNPQKNKMEFFYRSNDI